jgi:hypothetical protein
MDTNQPKFLIIGNKENVEKVLNRLPNKNKLYNNYLYDVKEPFIEYGFFLHKEDETNNSGEFIVVVCPENINTYDKNIFTNVYFKTITALIICHNNYNDYYNNIINTKEIIHIMFTQFDKQNYEMNCKDLHHYNSNINSWINRIYHYIDIPFTTSNEFNKIDVFDFSDVCHIL